MFFMLYASRIRVLVMYSLPMVKPLVLVIQMELKQVHVMWFMWCACWYTLFCSGCVVFWYASIVCLHERRRNSAIFA